MILICSWNLLNQPPHSRVFSVENFFWISPLYQLVNVWKVSDIKQQKKHTTYPIGKEREKGKYWVTGPLLDSWPLLWAQASCTPQPGLWGSLCTAILFSFTKVCWSESPRTVFSSEDQQCIFTAAPDMQHPASSIQHAAPSMQHPASNIQPLTSFSLLRFPHSLLEFCLTSIVFVCERKIYFSVLTQN